MRYKKILEKVNKLSDSYAAMSNEKLQAQTKWFKERLSGGESLQSILPEAYATIREAAKRVLGLYPVSYTHLFKAVKAKAMRWRMERKADKSGVAMIEMTFLAPSELPQESTQSKILVDGKELPDFAEDRQDYQITYKGQRPKVSVEETNQVVSTVVDSGDDSLPVLVRLVSESGKQVKEYRIQLTKEKPVSEKTVAAVQEELPKLEFVEKDLAYKTVEKKDSTLYLGETRVEHE